MLIAGVVIITIPEKTMNVLDELKKIENVTTYGVHKDFHIIAVFEGKKSKDLENLSDRISKELDGVIGVYPTYINFEQEVQ